MNSPHSTTKSTRLSSAKRQKIEYTEQKKFNAKLSLYPEIEKVSFAIPNGGMRDIGTAIAMKYMGVKPGIPDYMIAIANEAYFGLFIEFKADTGRLSSSQIERGDALRARGYKVVVATSAVQAMEILMQYLGRANAVD